MVLVKIEKGISYMKIMAPILHSNQPQTSSPQKVSFTSSMVEFSKEELGHYIPGKGKKQLNALWKNINAIKKDHVHGDYYVDVVLKLAKSRDEFSKKVVAFVTFAGSQTAKLSTPLSKDGSSLRSRIQNKAGAMHWKMENDLGAESYEMNRRGYGWQWKEDWEG